MLTILLDMFRRISSSSPRLVDIETRGLEAMEKLNNLRVSVKDNLSREFILNDPSFYNENGYRRMVQQYQSAQINLDWILNQVDQFLVIIEQIYTVYPENKKYQARLDPLLDKIRATMNEMVQHPDEKEFSTAKIQGQLIMDVHTNLHEAANRLGSFFYNNIERKFIQVLSHNGSLPWTETRSETDRRTVLCSALVHLLYKGWAKTMETPAEGSVAPTIFFTSLLLLHKS